MVAIIVFVFFQIIIIAVTWSQTSKYRYKLIYEEDDYDTSEKNELMTIYDIFDKFRDNLSFKANYDIYAYSANDQKYKHYTINLQDMTRDGSTTYDSKYVIFNGYDSRELSNTMYYDVPQQLWMPLPEKPKWNYEDGLVTFRETQFFYCPLYSKKLNINFFIENNVIRNADNLLLFPEDSTTVPFTFERYFYIKFKKYINMGNVVNNNYFFEKQDNNWVLRTNIPTSRTNINVHSSMVGVYGSEKTHVISHPLKDIKIFEYYDSDGVLNKILYFEKSKKIKVYLINRYSASQQSFIFRKSKSIFKQDFSAIYDTYVPKLNDPKTVFTPNGIMEEFELPVLIYRNTVVHCRPTMLPVYNFYVKYEKQLQNFDDTIFPFAQIKYKKIEGQNLTAYFLVIGSVILEYSTISEIENAHPHQDNFDYGNYVIGNKYINDTNGTVETLFTVYIYPFRNFKRPIHDFQNLCLLEILDSKFAERRFFVEEYIPIYGLYNFDRVSS